MRAFEITSLKEFTNQLFLQETFDAFYVTEASFSTFATFHLDGHLHPEFFDTEEAAHLKEAHQIYAFWRQMKPTALQIIRGKRSPLQFKIVLSCSPAIRERFHNFGLLPEEQASYYLNLQFQNQKLFCTTGVSQKTFLPGVRPDNAWDDLLPKFLKSCGIACQEV